MPLNAFNQVMTSSYPFSLFSQIKSPGTKPTISSSSVSDDSFEVDTSFEDDIDDIESLPVTHKPENTTNSPPRKKRTSLNSFIRDALKYVIYGYSLLDI